MAQRLALILVALIFFSAQFHVSRKVHTEKTIATAIPDPIHFIVLGDTRNWGENDSNPIRRELTNFIVENNPEVKFIINSGDMVNRGGEQADWDRYFEDIENATKNNITFYYTVGNHEYYTYNLPDGSFGPPDEDLSTYLANVELPGNEKYYSFDFNQIHFVFINTDEISDESQKSWLMNDLESTSLDFIILVFHRPAYSIRGSSRVAAAHAIRAVIEPILIAYDVDVVFSGHDHYYYRTLRNGVVHIVTGGGGAPLASNNDLSEWREGDVFYSEYHYCNVTVTEKQVKIDLLIYHADNHSTILGDSVQLGTHGGIIYNEHEYKLIFTTRTWNEAKTDCEARGGHLVTLTSSNENDFVFNLAEQNIIWIGFTDETIEGEWQWVTGEGVNFTNWKSGEPNDADGGEDYTEMYVDGLWKDNGAPAVPSMTHYYICEWDDIVINTTTTKSTTSTTTMSTSTTPIVTTTTTATSITTTTTTTSTFTTPIVTTTMVSNGNIFLFLVFFFIILSWNQLRKRRKIS